MRIASFNVKAKLGEKQSGNMHNLTDFLASRDIDFCLLQEVGRERDVVGDNPSLLNGYELISKPYLCLLRRGQTYHLHNKCKSYQICLFNGKKIWIVAMENPFSNEYENHLSCFHEMSFKK